MGSKKLAEMINSTAVDIAELEKLIKRAYEDSLILVASKDREIKRLNVVVLQRAKEINELNAKITRLTSRGIEDMQKEIDEYKHRVAVLENELDTWAKFSEEG